MMAIGPEEQDDKCLARDPGQPQTSMREQTVACTLQLIPALLQLKETTIRKTELSTKNFGTTDRWLK